MDIEARVIEILTSNGYKSKGNDWQTYESAKRLCLMEIDAEGSEYDYIISVICRYLNV